MKNETDTDTPTQSLTALVRFSAEAAVIEGIQRSTYPPRKRPLASIFTEHERWPHFPPGTHEYAAVFLDRNWRILTVQSAGGRALAFREVEDPTEEAGGGLFDPPDDIRSLHLPVPAGAAVLGFYRSQTGSEVEKLTRGRADGTFRIADGEQSPRVLVSDLLAAYSVNEDDPPTGPPSVLSSPIAGLTAALAAKFRGLLPLPIMAWDPWPGPAGEIVGYTDLAVSGDPAERYNIVILGDGFSASELPDFDLRAEALTQGLLGISPFSQLVDRINVYGVRTISDCSGVSNCPGPNTPRKTYYEVKGHYVKNPGDPTSPGFCGSAKPGRIYAAIEPHVSKDLIDLFVVIVNCPVYGGSAFVHTDVAFVTLCNDIPQFINVAAHECGHAIARLGEEYISPVEWDPSDQLPNIVRRVEAPQAWWKTLALPGTELSPQNEFLIVHDCDVDSCPFEHNLFFPPSKPDMDGLGLFWGAQYVDDLASAASPASATCGLLCDTRGRDFFRGAARCKMRVITHDFCRVCSDLIRARIQST